MWTRPDRDATYGDAALATYSSLATYRPDSPLLTQARVEMSKLQSMFAQKNYDIAMYYFRDKAYDSAILYLKQVLENWPDAPRARDSGLRLVEAYRAIQYTEDANDACAALRAKYPTDGEVRRVCPPPPAAKPATTTQPVKPPTAGERTAAR
jgi:outer membrane protein assembly factor BamD